MFLICVHYANIFALRKISRIVNNLFSFASMDCNFQAVAGDFRDWAGTDMNAVIKWATDGYTSTVGWDFLMFDCHRWRSGYNPDVKEFYNKLDSFGSDVVCDMMIA